MNESYSETTRILILSGGSCDSFVMQLHHGIHIILWFHSLGCLLLLLLLLQLLWSNNSIEYSIICILGCEMTLLVFIGVQKGIRSNYSNRDSGTIKRVAVAWNLKTRILLTAILLLFLIARVIILIDCIIKFFVLLILRQFNVWLMII